MIKFLITSLIFISNISFAVTFKIQDPCSPETIVSVHKDISSLDQNIGNYTVEVLSSLNIPFLGSDGGMNSIFNTPIGLDALEVISDSEMRAYGWCYSVNDNYSDLMTDKMYFDSNEDTIEWYYGYAHYLDGEWQSFCMPAKEIAPLFVCKR